MENNIEYDINIYGNLMIIDNEKQNIKVVEVPNIKKLFYGKQQLVSFLEDKIKESKKQAKKYHKEREFDYQIYEEHAAEIYQEVLDFVRGGKDE